MTEIQEIQKTSDFKFEKFKAVAKNLEADLAAAAKDAGEGFKDIGKGFKEASKGIKYMSGGIKWSILFLSAAGFLYVVAAAAKPLS